MLLRRKVMQICIIERAETKGVEREGEGELLKEGDGERASAQT